MNDYRITTTVGTSTGPITAIDEKDARRIFKSSFKGEIATAELIRENTPATKAQEREALERIRAIIEPLGRRSYVGTALEGCLEDAEINIENDFGDSMKARWQDAERRVAEAVKETAAAKEELARAEHKIQDLENNVTFLQDKVIDSDDLTDIAQLIEDKLACINDDVEEAAACIVIAAEEPEGVLFQNAVKEHRAAKGQLEYYQALSQRIKHARGQ